VSRQEKKDIKKRRDIRDRKEESPRQE
jgi:hypothetical protein